jgi:hypothetical protein
MMGRGIGGMCMKKGHDSAGRNLNLRSSHSDQITLTNA